MSEASLIVARPAFSAIDLERVESELDTHLERCRETIASVIADARQGAVSWNTIKQPLSDVHNALSLFWSPISHLNSVMSSDRLREVYKAGLPKLTRYWTELGQNADLYNATLELKKCAEYEQLGEAEKREIDNDLRDFELSGVALSADKQARYLEIATELSRLASEFSDHVLDATNVWRLVIDDEARLDGIPDSAKTAASDRALQAGQGGWLLDLQFPTYYAVMTFATDRELRRELYTAFCTRASDQWTGPVVKNGETPESIENAKSGTSMRWDNAPLMRDILALRAEKAELLGFDSYADLSMVRKMVTSPDQVMSFLEDLAKRAVPAAKQEFIELVDFARDKLGLETLEAWDVMFASERLRQERFSLSQEALKPYFPATRVIPGMFEIVGRLFDVSIALINEADVYHDDVALYRITDNTGSVRGEFFMDNYARDKKRGGAWMDVCASRQRTADGVQLPIAYLTCNLTPPVGDDPALLTHTEVTTLFHEFGHGLHHMLTRIDAPGVSGICGVEWDAVELPSQFLENWCWERESLDLIAAHYQSGEPLPDALLDPLREARDFQAAMALVRQLEFSLLDMQLHLQSRPQSGGGAADVDATLKRVRDAVAVTPIPSFNRFANGFSHIFAGSYAAGYFSYKWAEVLSADAFERFREQGLFDRASGQAFLTEILERGGSREAMASYVAFRGREPRIDALLRQSGLDVVQAA